MKCTLMLALAVFMATGALYHEARGQQSPPVPAEEQPEVLTRGPVNEAFAQPVNLEDQNGLVAPKEPPADIEEIPPQERPAGDQYAWVPGYWAWDSERNDYIWVSGCWRAVPPGMYWVPGYWAKAATGWQWVPGFWAPVDNKEIEYLPEPPALTAVEPPGPSPSSDRIWVPPCWYWYGGDYVLRPGYWLAAQPNWVWVPSCYVRTPRGYVFASGHWDYVFARRGVLFAPVYFPRRVYERRGFSYSLSIAVNIGNLEFGLFTRPQYSHFYFGDYYDSVYISFGIFPRYECERRHTWYDPNYMHDRWRHHRARPHWEAYERQEYERRRADKRLRPPRTYREMEHRVSGMRVAQRRNIEIAGPMKHVVAEKKTMYKLEQIRPEVRRQISQHSNNVHTFVKERSRWEAQGPVARTRPPEAQYRRPSTPRTGQETHPAHTGAQQERTSEYRIPTPAERQHRGEVKERRIEGPGVSREQQRPLRGSVSRPEPYRSDKVTVRNPPVSSRQGGGTPRKGQPVWPLQEQDDSNRRDSMPRRGSER